MTSAAALCQRVTIGLPSYDEALNHPQPTGAQGGEGIQELESYLQMEQNIGGAPQRPS